MKALNGIRLLDLSHILSGPYCGMLLADMGAEVIKIEPPGAGEGTRRLLADDPKFTLRNGLSAYFLPLNRNKKSVTLNLKSDQGLEIFYDLVKQADVVLDNFSVGVTGRLKIDHAHLSALNSRIITASITGFGEYGPGRDWVAFDMVSQAMGGGMSITGFPENPPTRNGLPIGDLCGGLMATIGILSALTARAQTGRGQHVDISMLDAQISLLTYVAAMYSLSGELPQRNGNSHFAHIPYDTYPTSDGYLIIPIVSNEFWPPLVRILGLEELDTEENKVATGRWRNKHAINYRLSERFKTNTQAYWLEVLRTARIPCAPVYNIGQAMSDPQVIARNMVIDIVYPDGERVQVPGNPIKLSETYEDTFTPPPFLGEHTDSVLTTILGKSEDEIAALRAAGVI